MAQAVQKRVIYSTLHNFLFTVKYQDVPGAYSFFASRVQLLISSDELQAYFDSCIGQYLSDYEQISIEEFSIFFTHNANQNKPQGTVAYVKGSLYDSSGFLGHYEAYLEREYGQWLIHTFTLLNQEQLCQLSP